MTTIVPFSPPPNGPFVFQPTLDGQTYTISVEWLLAGQRWYLNCKDLGGNPIFYLPMIGSPTGIPIETLSWASSTATVTTSQPHGYQIASVVELTLSGASPAQYDGVFDCLITDVDAFTFDLSGDPGPTVAPGTVSYNANLVDGYFFQSTLVFRESANWFEVTP